MNVGYGHRSTQADIRLCVAIQRALERDPRLDEREVGINVRRGVVALVGNVPHYSQRSVAAEIAAQVAGVRTIANEIEVRSLKGDERSDVDIARAVSLCLESCSAPQDDSIQAVVKHGWVTLTGQAASRCEQLAGEIAIRRLPGVLGIVNGITLAAAPNSRVRLQQEQQEGVDLEFSIGSDVEIAVRGTSVTLRGIVGSDRTRNDAAALVLSVPGVVHVQNLLAVIPPSQAMPAEE